MPRVLLVIAALTMLTGCAESAMKTWIGHPETELLASWGAPDKTAQSGNKKFHTWDGRNGYGQIICTKTFVVGPTGVILSYSTNCL